MLTLRLHLDPCPDDNAPLVVALASQRRRVAADEAAAIAAGHRHLACIADAGDVWAYATPILHRSERSVRPARRRVLPIDFAAGALPAGVEWAF